MPISLNEKVYDIVNRVSYIIDFNEFYIINIRGKAILLKYSVRIGVSYHVVCKMSII
jgi:hypothetical protein